MPEFFKKKKKKEGFKFSKVDPLNRNFFLMSSFEQPDAKRAKLEPPPSPPTQPLATPPPPTVSDRAAWGHEMDALKARHLAALAQKDRTIVQCVEDRYAAVAAKAAAVAAAEATVALRDAAIQGLVPAPPTLVSARSDFAGSLTVWWTAPRRRRGGELVVCAIDCASGELLDELGRAQPSASGAQIVDAARLVAGRTLRIFVRATLADAPLVPPAHFKRSPPTPPLTIGAQLQAEATINARALLRGDAVALARYRSDPRGRWSAAHHGGVRRVLHTRGFGLLATVRLARLEPCASLRGARRAVCALRGAMGRILRFALPHCTPTKLELRALVKACHDGHVATVTQYLRDGIDPNEVDAAGSTNPKNRGAPLIVIATRSRSQATVGALIAAGADVNKPKPNGVGALTLAAWGGDATIASRLLLAGAHEGTRDANGSTALHIAAMRGHSAVVALLLSRGARKNQANGEGRTPLWYAANEGKVATLALLLAAQVDVEALSREDGTTPLFAAAANGHCNVVKRLLAAEAFVDARNADAVTPLIMAVSREYGEVVQLLLRAGADRELVWNGETALDYANNAGLEEMATLLRA